jgi:hypothetical protein
MSGNSLHEVLVEAFAAARAAPDEYGRAVSLAVISTQLSGDQLVSCLAEALTATRTIREEFDRANVLLTLVPALTNDLLGEALGVRAHNIGQ